MSSSSASPRDQALAGERRCVLVVEDELLIRLILSDELREAGYQVIEACHAGEAIEILGTVDVDLIVSDVRMPGPMDGIGLLAHVREIFPILPVIITSGHLLPDQVLLEGATHFMAKPYSMERVIATVQDLLGKPR